MPQQKSNDTAVFSQLVSIKDAADQLNMSRHTLYRKIRKGQIRCVEVGGYKTLTPAEIKRVKALAS